MPKTEVFVTEQEKLFYELGKSLGNLTLEQQKSFLDGLQNKLSNVDDHSQERDDIQTKNTLNHNRLEKFVHSALSSNDLEKGIEKAARESIHSNTTAFFNGYRSAKTSTEEKSHSVPQRSRS
jgi:hypothetical protein